MPVARIGGAALWGVEAHPVVVEVDVSPGLPGLTTVGLPDCAVRESRVRVKSAIQNSGFEFPSRRVAVNLAPADLPKQGTGLDLPIALAILAGSGQLGGALANVWAIGELSLEGKVRAVPGALPALLAARRERVRRVLIPAACGASAALVPEVETWQVGSLAEAVAALGAGAAPEVTQSDDQGAGGGVPDGSRAREEDLDLSEVRGQSLGRRALEIAAAGGHSLLMVGPPGAGKTMLAQRLPGLLPALHGDDVLEVSSIYSVAQPERLRGGPVIRPPFRAPHHALSLAALIGGGPDPRPGELSLAHRGVLFLDELSEFRPAVLEALRQPLEEGEVRISRCRRTVRFPARPILIAALNPCPCGFRGDPVKPCTCPESALRRHQRCLSGPLLDRIDLRVEMPRPSPESLEAPAEPSAVVRARVLAARERMVERGGKRAIGQESPGAEADERPLRPSRFLNADLRPSELARACPLGAGPLRLLRAASERFALSPRAVHRVLRVAATLADLEGSDAVLERHLAEAVQYRIEIAEGRHF